MGFMDDLLKEVEKPEEPDPEKKETPAAEQTPAKVFFEYGDEFNQAYGK
jgi:hypothetical protein